MSESFHSCQKRLLKRTNLVGVGFVIEWCACTAGTYECVLTHIELNILVPRLIARDGHLLELRLGRLDAKRKRRVHDGEGANRSASSKKIVYVLKLLYVLLLLLFVHSVWTNSG